MEIENLKDIIPPEMKIIHKEINLNEKNNESLNQNIIELKKTYQNNNLESEEKKSTPLLSRNFTEKSRSNTIKYFKELLENHKIMKRKIFLKKKVKTWIIIVYYLLSSITNIISILLFIIDSETSDPKFQSILQIFDFSIAIFFTIEFFINFAYSDKKKYYFIKIESLIDEITIIPSYLNFLISKVSVNLSFLRIFRVLRVLRVLRLIKYVKMLKSDEGEQENERTSGLRINKVKKQIISFIVSLISTIFVSAGIVIVLQNYIPDSFNVSELTFIEAVYFIIITSSTLGYGDIVPTNTISRLLVIFLLIFLIYFFSDQIASIVNLLRIEENNEVSLEYENHNIIIGDLSVDRLKNFLDDYYDIYNLNVQIKKMPFTIIILDEKNSSIQNRLSLEHYENKVHFLKTKNYTIDAFIKSNFEEADTIICLNHNYKDNPLISDKINYFILKNIKDFQSSTNPNFEKKKLYLQSLILKENIFSKTLSPLFNFQTLKLKSSLIAKSIYCKGFLTFITNLIVKANKLNGFKIIFKNQMLNYYVKGIKNSIVIVKFPKDFIGVKYFKLFRKIYFKSVNRYPLFDKRNDTNNENEYKRTVMNSNQINQTQQSREDERKLFEVLMKKQSDIEKSDSINLGGVLLFGILEKKFLNIKSGESDDLNNKIEQALGRNIEKISFNPSKDYIISELDSGVFITSMNELEIQALLESIDLNIEKENKKNQEEVVIKENEKIARHLNSHFRENEMKNMDFFAKQHLRLKSQKPSSRFIEADLFSTNITNQIMIFGFPYHIEEIISKIRVQNLWNPILILSETFNEEIKQKLLKKYLNVYLVLGDFLDLNTLETVHIEKSSFIIILSDESINNINKDSNAVLAGRIIEQYFQIPYIVEIFHNENSKFLGSLPFLNDDFAHEMTEFLYPNYMQGKIFFTSFLDKLLPRSFNSLNEVICLQQLIENDFKSEEEILDDEEDKNDQDIKLYTKSKYNFFSILVPPYLVGKNYYELFSDLTSLEKMYIPLGIYASSSNPRIEYNGSNRIKEKCEKCKMCQNCIDEINCKDCRTCISCNNDNNIEDINLINKYLNIINNEIKHNVLEYIYIENLSTPVFITNPPIDFILEKNMEVLIYGKFDKMSNCQSDQSLSKLNEFSRNLDKFSQKKEIMSKLDTFLNNRLNEIN